MHSHPETTSQVSLVHNLKRQFFWFANVLFLEEVNTQKVPTFVCLSDTDQIVPIHEIKAYVERYNKGEVIVGEHAVPQVGSFVFFNLRPSLFLGRIIFYAGSHLYLLPC
jgi:hypothetical protein